MVRYTDDPFSSSLSPSNYEDRQEANPMFLDNPKDDKYLGRKQINQYEEAHFSKKEFEKKDIKLSN